MRAEPRQDLVVHRGPPPVIVTDRRRPKRTPEANRRMIASRRRNARAAAREGRPYGPNRGKSGAPVAAPRAVGGARLAGAGEASAYLREASRRALALVTEGVPKAAPVLGLIELAREALGYVK